MDAIQEIKLNNGQVLVSITGYGGEDDFYAMYHIIEERFSRSILPTAWTVCAWTALFARTDFWYA